MVHSRMAWFSSNSAKMRSVEDVDYLEELIPSPRSGRAVDFSNRVRKSLYYGCYSDASLPSWPVTDVAVEVLNNAVTSRKRQLDRNYATRVARRAKISPCTLMMGMLYAERLRARNSDSLKKMSSSDLFLISIMLASKYLYDEGEDEEVFNDEWAKSGSRSTSEVNRLEMEFLSSIDWNLFVSNQEFLNFVNKVETRVAVTNGLSRGWFSYLDIHTLLENTAFQQTIKSLGQETVKVVLTCTMAYIVGLALLCSASAAVHIHQTRCLREMTTSTCTLHPSRCLATDLQYLCVRPRPEECAPKPGGISVNASGRLKLQSQVLSNQTNVCATVDSCPVNAKLVGLKEDNKAFSVDDKGFKNNDHIQTRLESLEFSIDTHTGERIEDLLKWFKTSILSKNRSLNFCSKDCKKKIKSNAVSLGFSALNDAFTYHAVPGDIYSPRLVLS